MPSNARDLILQFDTEYDIPLRHNECLGALLRLGAFEPPQVSAPTSLGDLATFVGASWCRMVSHDVRYEMGDSLQAYLASRHASNKLLDQVNGDAKDPFAAYVAARWCDGAGKCQYRVSRYREASRLFQRAAQLADRHNLWWIIPDLSSNRLRARQEAIRVAAGGVWNGDTINEFQEQIDEIKSDFKEAVDTALGVLSVKGIPFSDGRIVQPVDCLAREHREFLRGYSSLLHNFSIIPGLPTAASLESSEASAEICRSLGDAYRLGQALNQQQIVKRKRPETHGQANEIIDEMLRGKWRRGQQIARQARAYLDGQDAARAETALLGLKQLLDEVNDARQLRGNEFGLDLDFPNYTVGFAADVLRRHPDLEKAKVTGDVTWSEYITGERLKNARSLRKVVTIAEDKFTYSERTVQPAYRPEIERLISEVEALQLENLDEAESIMDEIISLVEESTSREVLDLMGLNRHLPKFPKQISQRFAAEVDTEIRWTKGDSSEERKLLRKADDGSELEQVAQRAQQYSEELLERPIEMEDVDPDIGERLRLLAASQKDLCIIRYFLYGTPPKWQLGALVVINDLYQVIKIPGYYELNELRERLVEKARALTAPDPEDCRNIHRLVMAPIFQILDDACHRPSELVIIPAGRLFELPLHVAWMDNEQAPLAACFPLVFAVSVNSLLRDARFLLRRQFVVSNDDLCAMIVGDSDTDFGNEIAELEWPRDHFFIAGIRPSAKVFAHRYWPPKGQPNSATLEAFQALCATQPEFLVYSGHGIYKEANKNLPVLLELRTSACEKDYLSELDIAANVQLRRNKLTVISACVAGLGASRREGEVAGFVRSFVAAGCGLLGLALWPVLTEEIEKSTHTLLRNALSKMDKHSIVDFPTALQEHYDRRGKDLAGSPQDWIEACPLLLFL